MLSSIRRFIASESIGGVVLAAAALLALIVSNSSLGPWYESFLHLRTETPSDFALMVIAL